MNVTRRGLLHGGLATGTLLALPSRGWSQASSLPGLPRIALVLGNGKYRDAPLRNPANDARAIGATLTGTGFAVTLRTDVGRAEMTASLKAYVAELARRKGVGLFYFAGHGVQLAWRNYMLPVDAETATIEDIQKHGVEVNGLLDDLSETEKNRQFDEELALWAAVRGSTEPAPLEDYLRRHPSGRFAELAQLRLDHVLARRGERKVRIAPAEGNPFTRGSAAANTGWSVGDSYTYRVVDRLAHSEERHVFSVSEITESEVRFANGQVVDLLGNILRRPGGRVYTPNQLEPVDYAVGKQWRTEFRISTPRGTEGTSTFDLRIVTRESIAVPAGTFNAFRVEGRGVFDNPAHRHAEETLLRKWVAPDRLRLPVVLEEIRQRGGGRRAYVLQSRRWELTAFRES